MAEFLAEAVSLLSRKPQEFHEAQRAILAQRTGSASAAAAAAARPLEHSLLAVVALRQAVRVSVSSKMPADARAAVAGYVAGEPLNCDHNMSVV